MSLQDVESASQQRFKASVLGAYERGERAISVARLERLATLYHVPVDQLFPPTGSPRIASLDPGHAVALTIDLERLDRLEGPMFALLRRFLRIVQVQRQDFNGRVITVPASDVMALAAILDVTMSEVSHRIDELGLRFERGRD